MPKKKIENGLAPDHVIAQLAAARSAAKIALEFIDDATELFLSPGDDPDDGRTDALEGALDTLGEASRFVELAQKTALKTDPDEAPAWMPAEDEDEEEGRADD